MAWEKGTEVRRIDNPGKTGVTTGQVRQRGALAYFGVRWQDGWPCLIAPRPIRSSETWTFSP